MTETDKILKCSDDSFCTNLYSRLNENNSTKAGLACSTLIIMKTGVVYSSTPAFRTGAKDNGLYIQFCPFCGVNLYEIWERRQKHANSVDRQGKPIKVAKFSNCTKCGARYPQGKSVAAALRQRVTSAECTATQVDTKR